MREARAAIGHGSLKIHDFHKRVEWPPSKQRLIWSSSGLAASAARLKILSGQIELIDRLEKETT
jgi:hypothetical protein